VANQIQLHECNRLPSNRKKKQAVLRESQFQKWHFSELKDCERAEFTIFVDQIPAKQTLRHFPERV
jgi:hypothetical protein